MTDKANDSADPENSIVQRTHNNQRQGKNNQVMIEKFLANQTQELTIRAQELELEKQKDNNGFQFAQKSLDAQIADRRHQREFESKNRKSLYLLIVLIIIAICALVAFALNLNKDDVAKEIIKSITYVATGFLGGYGTAKLRQKQDLPKRDPGEDE